MLADNCCACVSSVQKITYFVAYLNCHLQFFSFPNLPTVVSEIKCSCNLYNFSEMSESGVRTNKAESTSWVLWLLSLHSQLLVPRLNFQKHLKHLELGLMKNTTYSLLCSWIFFHFLKRSCNVFCVTESLNVYFYFKSSNIH